MDDYPPARRPRNWTLLKALRASGPTTALCAANIILLLLVPLIVAAQSPSGQPSKVGLVSTLVGEGVVTHAGYTEPAPLRLRDDVLLQDRIETKEQSVVRVLFGGRITVTIRERSIVTVTDDPLRPRVELESGKLAFKVHPNGLRPGEVGEIYTPNSVAGIRGSLVIAEVGGPPEQPDSHISVVEASHTITVAPRANPTQIVGLKPGEAVTVSGLRATARVSPVRRMPPEHLSRVAEMAEIPGRSRDGGQERGPWANHPGHGRYQAGQQPRRRPAPFNGHRGDDSDPPAHAVNEAESGHVLPPGRRPYEGRTR